MILIVHRLNKEEQSYQFLLLQRLCVSTMVILGLDVVFRFVNGGNSYILIYITTWLYFLFETIPMIIWLCYLDFFIHKSQKRLRQRLYYSPIFMFIFLLMALNPATSLVFSIDGRNFYQKGPFVVLIVIFNVLILLVTLITALKRKRDIGQRAFLSLVTFGLIPLMGTLLQQFLAGSILIWPSVAFAVIFLYIFFGVKRDQKDYLTGLLNRQQIDKIILYRTSMIERRGGFSLLMIDMDSFKLINDNYGHKEGDRALVQVANLLFHSVRMIDKVGRFGGDEFLVLLEEVDPEEIKKVISRIHSDVDSFNRTGPLPYDLSLSCGYNTIREGEELSLYDHIHEADRDMYRVKQEKKVVR